MGGWVACCRCARESQRIDQFTYEEFRKWDVSYIVPRDTDIKFLAL